jgi:hypothetical protein
MRRKVANNSLFVNALEKYLFTVLAVDVMLINQAQQTNSLTDETNCNRSKEILYSQFY